MGMLLLMMVKDIFIDTNGKMVDTLPIFEGIGTFMENGVIYSIIENAGYIYFLQEI